MKFDIQEVMNQAKRMQDEVDKIKKELDNKTVSADAGGGFVNAVMTGNGKLVSIKLATELLSQNDISMVEDLVVAAVNKAIEKSSQLASDEMGKVRNMLPNIPGLNLGL